MSDKNQLANANSPYLRQHAYNPVHWYEWGDAAFAKAKNENKPIIVSVGYAACHWCHVMAHESFDDKTVAAIMNENFVNIKVDREERPDVDQIYMDAALLINGNGGWPLNAFALPDGRPFHAGTYYPKQQWIQVLETLAKVYRDDPDKVKEQATRLVKGIEGRYQFEATTAEGNFQKEDYHRAATSILNIVDMNKGGMQGAPKFPMPTIWELLMQAHYLYADDQCLDAVTTTLDQMADGGIYDQLGGGFARYSVDGRWHVPHFEKMLYDNAQLLTTYAQAYKITRKPRYAEILEQTICFMKRELMDEDGLFWSSLDADSEGEEGTFYVWTAEEVSSILNSQELAFAKAYYRITKMGNWEDGKNILDIDQSIAETATELGISDNRAEQLLSECRKKLFEQRENRERPATDKKIITSWNAMAISGLVEAFHATGKREHLEMALQTMTNLQEKLIEEGNLYRSLFDGELGALGFADDHSFLIKSYLDLYAATFDKQFLDQALKWAEKTIRLFSQEGNPLLAYTRNTASSLAATTVETEDTVIPSSNAVFADVLFDLGEYYQRQKFKDRAVNMFYIAQSRMKTSSYPYFSKWLQLAGKIAYQPYEIAIMGENAIDYNLELQENYLPTSLFMGGQEEYLPLLENKSNSTTQIFVCRDRTCRLPVGNIAEALEQILQSKK